MTAAAEEDLQNTLGRGFDALKSAREQLDELNAILARAQGQRDDILKMIGGIECGLRYGKFFKDELEKI